MTHTTKATLLVEVSPHESALVPPSGEELSRSPDDGGFFAAEGRSSTTKSALERFVPVAMDVDAIVAAVSQTVESLAEAFRPKEGGPASCEVKFGLEVSGSGNVILAKMGSKVNLEVKLTWNREGAAK